MHRTIDDPLAAPNTGAYSPALRVGPWILVSGQGPLRPDGAVIPGNIAAQTRATLDNIRRLVEAAGGSMETVVKCTCYIHDINEFSEFDAAYRATFSEPYPTRTTVEAGLDGILVEIDAMAYLGDDR
jgi:2-iminobutanoate/2-iminopropanoate deaminase